MSAAVYTAAVCSLSRTRAASRAGFTLVEVLAAIAILGAAMFVLLDAHYTSMRLHETMQMTADFRQMLETTVARAEVGVSLEEYSGSGDFGAKYPGFTWSYDATLVGSETIQLYEVVARVSGPEEEQVRTFLVYSVKTPEESQGVGMFRRNQGGGNTGAGAASSAGAAGRAARGGGGMFN
jgi:prepilin-type N-terminal cleavage/methylation domain-containing protein